MLLGEFQKEEPSEGSHGIGFEHVLYDPSGTILELCNSQTTMPPVAWADHWGYVETLLPDLHPKIVEGTVHTTETPTH